jgi:exonuclease V
VTDLVSPAWCEQQYWYSLTRFGRVRRTKAMKQGSSVHKVLEEQVHKEVKIDVQTREDMFGLRIWNVIQGLRTLRATGMTREMEVWGVLNGEVVNGIIDEINMFCPDEEAEKAMLQKEEAAKDGAHKSKPLEAGQKTLAGFFKDSQNANILEDHFRSAPTSHDETASTFYLSDVKTRQSKSLPPNGSASKPVYMQLMLYRRLFASLAANETEADKVFERYNLDSHAIFSDTFIAEISQLDFSFSESASSYDDEGQNLFKGSQDPVSDLLAHNSLSSLWSFMIAEFARTIPIPIPPSPNVRSSISKLVVAEYRSGGTGEIIGKKAFVHDDVVLDAYANDEIRWWRGERATKGVDVEDASKCRICEFAEGCSWRVEKLEEAKKKARLRNGPKKSEV